MIKDCCKVAANLVAQPQDPERPEVSINVCSVCSARHIRAKVTLTEKNSNIIELLLSMHQKLSNMESRLAALENKG